MLACIGGPPLRIYILSAVDNNDETSIIGIETKKPDKVQVVEKWPVQNLLLFYGYCGLQLRRLIPQARKYIHRQTAAGWSLFSTYIYTAIRRMDDREKYTVIITMPERSSKRIVSATWHYCLF